MARKGNSRVMKQPNQSKQSPNLNAKKKRLFELVDLLLLKVATQSPVQLSILKELEEHEQIVAITDQINDLEKDIKVVGAGCQRADDAALKRFTTWLDENGASCAGSDIAQFDGYDLGLKARHDIKQDSLIIAVPRKIMLTVDAAKKSKLKSLIEKDTILKNMPNVALSMFLLYEKFSEHSFWKPYLDLLPRSYSTVLYFSVDDLRELIGSPSLRNALAQIRHICRQYAYFWKIINLSDDAACLAMRGKFTFREYWKEKGFMRFSAEGAIQNMLDKLGELWAASTIMTRQNSIPSKDQSVVINALIPLWDFCNHTNGNISTDYNPELDRSECLALRDFKKGEQLFIFYGARTNADLFIHNGFVYEENEHDGLGLGLGISQADKLREKRVIVLEKLFLNPNTVFYLNKGPQPITGDLLAFLRIFNMNEEQLDHWIRSDKTDDLKCLDCALDTSLETKMWNFLATRLKLVTMAYKTSLDDDEAILKVTESTNQRIAVQMRVTEKRILRYVSEYVEQRLKQ